MRLRLPLAAPLVAVGAMVLLAACGGSGGSAATSSAATASPTASAPSLTGTSWLLASYAGPGGQPVDAVTDAPAALDLRDKGLMGGTTGCNSFTGTYTQDGWSLTVAPGPMTLVACVDPAASAQEKAILDALKRTASFSGGSGADLVLTDAQGATLLTYRAGISGVGGTSWRATGVNNGKGGVVQQAGTEKVTAVFAEGGELTGSGGCNDYRGTWAVSGKDRLTIGPLATTKKLCEPDVNEIEQQYLTALAKVSRYEISGVTLTLRDDAGATQVAYRLDTP